MIIDESIKIFTEKYDRFAIESIDNMSNDSRIINQKIKFETFNIDESFDGFIKLLESYAGYRCKYKDSDVVSSIDTITKSFRNYIDNEIFKENTIYLHESSDFVKSYLTGVDKLLKSINESKNYMLENNAEQEDIGKINDLVDMFMEKMNSSFTTVTDKILWASGYNSSKAIEKMFTVKKERPVFL